jgi:hypothetical protein
MVSIHPGPTFDQGTSAIEPSTPSAAAGATVAGADVRTDVAGLLDDSFAAVELGDAEHPAAMIAARTATPTCMRNATARSGRDRWREMWFMVGSFRRLVCVGRDGQVAGGALSDSQVILGATRYAPMRPIAAWANCRSLSREVAYQPVARKDWSHLRANTPAQAGANVFRANGFVDWPSDPPSAE